MECELCGRPVTQLYEAKVEGAVIRVCKECLGYGEKVRVVREKRSTKEIYEFIEGYGKLIKEKRKELGYTLGELAKMVGIKKEALKKIEDEKIFPSERVADKLEEVLGIKIKEEEERAIAKKEFTLTLGDVVKVKGSD